MVNEKNTFAHGRIFLLCAILLLDIYTFKYLNVRLSIVIPTLNEEAYLPLLLRSIDQQSLTDYEVIVADAESTDRTVEIAKSFGAAVVAGGMPGAGRNAGAAVAKGDVIVFFDADVILLDDHFLEDTLCEFDAREFGAASCRVKPLSDKMIDRAMHWVYNAYLTSTASVLPHAPGFCIFARREVHEKIGGFDESVQFAEDQEYVMRAAKVSTFGFLQSHPIPVSMRRLERDGRFVTATKNLLAELHMRTIGPVRTDFLKYRFGYENEKDSRG